MTKRLLIVAFFIFQNIASKSLAGEYSNCQLETILMGEKFDDFHQEKSLTLKNGDRKQLKFPDFGWNCEISYQGSGNGTYINCWSSDRKWGAKSDRSSLKGKKASAEWNALTVAHAGHSVNLKLSCQ